MASFKKKTCVVAINITLGVPGPRADTHRLLYTISITQSSRGDLVVAAFNRQNVLEICRSLKAATEFEAVAATAVSRQGPYEINTATPREKLRCSCELGVF
jgi:hypothetical protein